jgi:hypothetical protein
MKPSFYVETVLRGILRRHSIGDYSRGIYGNGHFKKQKRNGKCYI